MLKYLYSGFWNSTVGQCTVASPVGKEDLTMSRILHVVLLTRCWTTLLELCSLQSKHQTDQLLHWCRLLSWCGSSVSIKFSDTSNSQQVFIWVYLLYSSFFYCYLFWFIVHQAPFSVYGSIRVYCIVISSKRTCFPNWVMIYALWQITKLQTFLTPNHHLLLPLSENSVNFTL